MQHGCAGVIVDVDELHLVVLHLVVTPGCTSAVVVDELHLVVLHLVVLHLVVQVRLLLTSYTWLCYNTWLCRCGCR